MPCPRRSGGKGGGLAILGLPVAALAARLRHELGDMIARNFGDVIAETKGHLELEYAGIGLAEASR